MTQRGHALSITASALAALLLAGCTSSPRPSTSVTPAATVSSSASATKPGAKPTKKAPKPTASPTATATATATGARLTGIRLNGADLKATRDGQALTVAVAAVTKVLGPPLKNPTTDTACVDAGSEVAWAHFRLAATKGVVTGWVTTDPRLRTPSGVGVGTTVATLRRVYGTRLTLLKPNPDNGWTFFVKNVDQEGALTGGAATATVTSLRHGSCHSI